MDYSTIMASATTINSNDGASPFEPLSPRSSVHEPTGTNLDPIVLDDDSGDDMTQEVRTLARKERQRIPYRRRKVPSNADDAKGTFTPPRTFDEILQDESAYEDRARLDDKMASLQAEISRLESVRLENNRMKEERTTTLITLDATKKSEDTYKARLEQSQLEIDRLSEELKFTQLQIAEMTKTKDLLQKELATQRQLGQEREAEIAKTKKAEQDAQNQSSLARRYLQKARADKFEIYEELRKAKATISTMTSEHDDFVANSRTESETAEEKMGNLQLRLDKVQSAYETLRLNRDRDQERMKETTNERRELWKRVEVLESKGLADKEVKERLIIELAVAKQNVSRTAAAESSLQEAQQRIEELEDHMRRCPKAQKSDEFWDDIYKRTGENQDVLDKHVASLKKNLNAKTSPPA
ncbi:hypothetical protein F5Y12DRAFT_586534 [Xylaria sp. FL1777]|nr:hypothetical protein F5Y12DRAFT_586534 [Xylaria sp. FL1777]